jgi:hypothetical protein
MVYWVTLMAIARQAGEDGFRFAGVGTTGRAWLELAFGVPGRVRLTGAVV